MSDRTIQLALVGAGGIGKVWALGAKKTKGIVICAVVDIDEARARSVAQDFPNARAHSDITRILADPELDGVIVATPHKLLAPISRQALEAGKHVLCEKPAGITAREVEGNMRLAEKSGLVYMVAYKHRYHAAYQMAKDLFDRGEIGKPLFMRERYGFGGRPNYEKEWRFMKEISGGGELIDQGVQMIDIARWFLGEFENVHGFAENLFWGGEVEDNGFLLLRTKDHRVAQIHVSWTNWEWIHSIEVFGTKGYLCIDGLDQRYRGPERLTIGRVDPRLPKFPEEEVVRFEGEQKENSFGRELAAFRAAIVDGAKDYPNGRDGYEALRIVERIYAMHT